ncbi:DUF58 domain-containing protein [Spelaeicoccus albus]|uniref:Uncharacterized protein (DUF58 family) n=1 Tax=Spelaeicoccus albus TaxID=1280376 RepID=A0A7Z0IHV3_9MICO|nr:DUF58 domain-containing protein [Spelaeicoccus albus]NYI67954.1 uncharacterized protein (DUF58 family) [Spelaeicoccus albus]
MALSGRFVLLVLAGLLPLLAWPTWTCALTIIGVLIIVLAADVLLAASPRLLAISRMAPTSVRLGNPTEAVITVRNASGRTFRGVVRDAWPPSAGATGNRHGATIRPGERRRYTTALLPIRRGDRVAAAVTIRSFGPLRMGARQATIDVPARLRVLPAFTSRRHLPSKLARLRELDGRASVMIRGSGTEFDSLRDYVDGDDVRSIDWRATARRREVVVRTWRPERDRRVLIVVDTSRTSAGRVGGEPRLDAAIESALLLTALATKAGDRVDLVAADRRVRARVHGAGPGDSLPAVVRALAPLEPELIEADWSTIAGTALTTARQRSFIVLLTPLESAAVTEGMLPVIRRLTAKHTVAVASVADPATPLVGTHRDSSTEAYAAAAAERSMLDRAAVTAALQADGASVVDAPPDELPPRLADLYLSLKAAGRL